MKYVIRKLAVLFLFILLLAFTTTQGVEVGVWTGEDQGKVGSVIFEEQGYASFVVDGKKVGGKYFVQNDTEFSMKYEIDYDQTPIHVDFIFKPLSTNTKDIRIKGIMEFKDKNTLKIALNFNTGVENTRPSKFTDDNSVVLNKVN